MSTERELVRSFVDRIQRLDEEAKALNEDRRGVYKEAKDKQINTKALKRVIAAERREASEVDQETEVFERYRSFVHGTDNATRARPHATQKSEPEPVVALALIRSGESDAVRETALRAGSDPLDLRNTPMWRGEARS